MTQRPVVSGGRDQPHRDAAEEPNVATWQSVDARWSILSTGWMNMCREQASPA